MKPEVLILGAGFAGLACAKKLAKERSLNVTLIDRNNYNEFTPLLYQVATFRLSADASAAPLRRLFAGKKQIAIKMANAASVDPKTLSITTDEGQAFRADYLVLALGAKVNFFDTKGASGFALPLYTLNDAERLKSHLIAAFEMADRDPASVDRGVLNFVIIGGGPTGTELAGALADLINGPLPKEFPDLSLEKAAIYIINDTAHLLGPFSKESQEYAAKTLIKRGVKLKLNTLVEEVSERGVKLSNGETILSQNVIWAGGLTVPALKGTEEIPQGHGGRLQVQEDLSVKDYPNLFIAGDMACIQNEEGKALPQLASVAMQSGEFVAENILRRIKGQSTAPFRYEDKGVMAMIGRDAAILEIGKKRRELIGLLAYFGWLAVHLALMPTLFQKMQACLQWIFDLFGSVPALQILDFKPKERE